MYEEIQKGCYREIGAMIARLMFIGGIMIAIITVPALLRMGGIAGIISRTILNTINFNDNMLRAIIAGTSPAAAFLIFVAIKKGLTGHVIHAEWWNGMHIMEKVFSLLLMAFIIGMSIFSLSYWLMTRG